MPDLASILGQDRAVSALLRAAGAGRLHHAWLFHGPEGVGKRTTAEAFASLLLDPTTAPDLSGRLAPEPGSETQRLIASGAHPDLHIVRKELASYSRDATVRGRKQRNIPVEVIREFLLEPAALAAAMPQEGTLARKVFIVDEAHLLAREGANSMLKTLEEPPPGVVIILITDRESHLLPTIRSRCQRMAFVPLRDAEMAEWLGRAGVDARSGEGRWVASFCDGSPGRAQRALESGLYGWAQEAAGALEVIDRGGFPIEMGSRLWKLADDWAKESIKGDANASKEAANREGASRLFAVLAHEARRRMREAGSEGELMRAVRMAEAVALTEERMDANVNPSMAMEGLAAELSAP